MPGALRAGCLLLLLWGSFAGPARAQFPAVATQTLYVCNATGNQVGVQAFADGAGGAYSVWIDRRAGDGSGAGTAIFAQRLDAAGTRQWGTTGLRLFQTRRREIYGLSAVPWQNGMLVAWVQGAFNVGADSVRCQYYNAAGVPQWATPTVVAALNATASVYEGGLNVIPNDSGATVTHGLAFFFGGGSGFSFNRVNFAGRRRYSNQRFQLSLPGAGYFTAIADGSNGIYVAGSSGGLGTPIYAQRYDLFGTPWAAPFNLSATGAGGAGNSRWVLLRDPANALYVVWESAASDVIVEKITPAGLRAWAPPGFVNLCPNPSQQSNPAALWTNNALWVVWNDDRSNTGTLARTTYAQQMTAAGALAWPATGVLINSLPATFTHPKLAASDNGAVMAFFATGGSTGFRAQKILPNATLAFPANGVALHTTITDGPSAADFVPVSQPNGSVQVYWSSTGTVGTARDICAGRLQRTGTLLGAIERTAEAADFAAYPNPATAILRLRFPAGLAPSRLRLFDAQGRLLRDLPGSAITDQLSLTGLPPGFYTLRATCADHELTRRVVLE